jgi:hypothetical protein
MSNRAIQRLRQERETELPPEQDTDDEEDDRNAVGGSTAFAAMYHDDSDSDSSNEDDSEEDGADGRAQKLTSGNETKEDSRQSAEKTATTLAESETEDADQTEDLDTLLEEFKVQDKDTDDVQAREEDKSSWFDVVTSRIETRDLDIDYVMRTSLLGSNEDSAARSNRRGRQTSVFGPPQNGWPRPPHYVGGGIGMASYDNESRPLPWPYSDMKEGDDRCPGLDRWFKFMYSDSYERDSEAYERIKASGDPNALALFIADHPFVVEPLLQLSSVLYQTNQSQEGLSLLKRALWVYECASLNSFLKVEGRVAFMDYDQSENGLFFAALFKLIRVSHVAG